MSVDSLPTQMMTFIRNRQTKWISRELPIVTNHFQEGIHLAEVSVFDKMTGNNRHFRNLSQQVLSGVVDPSTNFYFKETCNLNCIDVVDC